MYNPIGLYFYWSFPFIKPKKQRQGGTKLSSIFKKMGIGIFIYLHTLLIYLFVWPYYLILQNYWINLQMVCCKMVFWGRLQEIWLIDHPLINTFVKSLHICLDFVYCLHFRLLLNIKTNRWLCLQIMIQNKGIWSKYVKLKMDWKRHWCYISLP